MTNKKEPFLVHVDNVTFDILTITKYKIEHLKAVATRKFKQKRILFYPEKPQVFHTMYKVCHKLGYTMTNNPNLRLDAAMAFDDTTVRKSSPILDKLNKKTHVINYLCNDISKKRVEKIFKEVFGYQTAIDPEKFKGEYVKKSDSNAVHDGKVMTQPTKPENGYIYQKLINNVYNNTIVDIRVTIVGNTIPYICERYRSVEDRFDNTQKAKLFDVNEKLSASEIEKVRIFAKKFGLEYGEIDTIRDSNDKKLYIVDVNNTPAGPRPGRHITKTEYKIYLSKLCQAFSNEFLNKS